MTTKTPTAAEQYATADEELCERLMLDVTTLTTTGDPVLEFDDGSAYDTDDSRGQAAYTSMSDWMQSISDCNAESAELLDLEEQLPPTTHSTIPPSGYIEVTGILTETHSGYPVDLPLVLTEIRRDGNPYLLGSTDRDEEPSDEAPIAYTDYLAALVGQRVTVRCQPSTYREGRATMHGNTYHVDVEYLDAPMVLSHSAK